MKRNSLLINDSESKDVELGKFISLILRHKPQVIGITLDQNGWADTQELLAGINASGRYIDMEILERIVRENGILKMNRQYVHLSADVETAKAVGKRHGKPVVLVIDTKKMVEDGYTFWLSDNGVWQSEDIKWKYVKKIVQV